MEARFESGKTGPNINYLQFKLGKIKLTWIRNSINRVDLKYESANGHWKCSLDARQFGELPINYFFFVTRKIKSEFKPIGNSPEINDEDLEKLRDIGINQRFFSETHPFAGAPVRSHPRRTYDPGRVAPDPEGEWIPKYLVTLRLTDRDLWNKLKDVVVEYGKLAGVFDEIRIQQFGSGGSGPFQIQVRKHDRRLKGPWRNLIDVGYGVSQILPLFIELLRPESANMFLLQQPEVHLHPSAQAALGTMFCQLTSQGKQLIVETHSDHLIDRVRMDIRDRKTKLRPNDVSFLYFERKGLDVHIHSLGIDEEGNILNAPQDYRRFFMDEVNRSIGIG